MSAIHYLERIIKLSSSEYAAVYFLAHRRTIIPPASLPYPNTTHGNSSKKLIFALPKSPLLQIICLVVDGYKKSACSRNATKCWAGEKAKEKPSSNRSTDMTPSSLLRPQASHFRADTAPLSTSLEFGSKISSASASSVAMIYDVLCCVCVVWLREER